MEVNMCSRYDIMNLTLKVDDVICVINVFAHRFCS